MKWVKLVILTGVIATLVSGSVLAQGLDLFETTVFEDGNLRIQHLNSYRNCCIPVSHEVNVSENIIFVREIESHLSICRCNCYFDVSWEISDLPPRFYNIVYTYDIDESINTITWVNEFFLIDIPGQVSPLEVPEFQSTQSACHDGELVENVAISLDKIKSFYR